MTDPMTAIEKGDGLLIVDVQRDFCPGGALPVERGDEVVEILNRWVAAAEAKGAPVYISRDWHPIRHKSFVEQGGKWPPHCIQDSEGARFHSSLNVPDGAIVITKGVRFDHDQNSAFDQTGLAEQLERDGVKRLWVGGLALDVCVAATVLDAREAGFAVNLLKTATRPVTAEGGREAIRKMKDAGATIIED